MKKWMAFRFSVALVLSMVFSHAVHAAITVTDTLGGGVTVSPGVIYENFDGYSLGNSGGSNGFGMTLSFSGDGAVVGPPPVTNVYAPPYLSGNNGVGFGSQPGGADQTHYVTTGTGSATLTFANSLDYFGILWGSVDNYNTIQFFSGATLVYTYVGNPSPASNGDQGINGTRYFEFIAGSSLDTFDSVVLTSTQKAFEVDNVAYRAASFAPTVPEPASLVVWSLLGLAGFVAYRRNRKTA